MHAFLEYLETVGYAMKITDPKCYDTVADAFRVIQDWVSAENDTAINSLFKYSCSLFMKLVFTPDPKFQAMYTLELQRSLRTSDFLRLFARWMDLGGAVYYCSESHEVGHTWIPLASTLRCRAVIQCSRTTAVS